MTYSPEARHFETRMPSGQTDQIQRDCGGEYLSAPMSGEPATAAATRDGAPIGWWQIAIGRAERCEGRRPAVPSQVRGSR